MKNSEFKKFRGAVGMAAASDPVWYAGYLWLRLTEKQCNEIASIMVAMGCKKENGNVYAPNGLGVKLPAELKEAPYWGRSITKVV